MFTGIITAKGKISHVQPLEKGVRLTIEAPGLKLADVALGDSIAHAGVCLTVIAKKKSSYQVDVSRETLDCTVGLDKLGGEVNLEKAMRLNGFHRRPPCLRPCRRRRRGGNVRSIGESHELVIKAPKSLAKYIARKGSIVVDGVSLTTNRVGSRAGASRST
jgi:riboflavin synthase